MAFFDDVYRAFLQAEKYAGGSVDRFYRIGDRTVRMRYANPQLLPFISPAFEHLATQSQDENLAFSICLWDSQSTNVSMPPPSWSWDDYGTRGQVNGFDIGSIHVVYHGESSACSILNEQQDTAIYWVKDSRLLSYYESSAPLRAIFAAWAASQGRLVVHSAAVGNDKGGVLITAKGGAGKSTTSLLCLQAGLNFLGDNNVILSDGAVPTAHSIYNATTLHPDQIRRMPFFASALAISDAPDSGKVIMFAKDYRPMQLKSSLPIRAILVPRITGKIETRLTPCSPAQSLAALAPSTIFSSAGAGKSALEFMARYVRRVRNYDLELGTDFDQIPTAITGLLSEIS